MMNGYYRFESCRDHSYFLTFAGNRNNMEWLLDLTADELRERSSRELEDYLTPEMEEKCRKHINKLIHQALEKGCSYIYITGYSPHKNYIPLFQQGSDTPLMTENLRAHLISKGLKVEAQEPFFNRVDDVREAYGSGAYCGSITISWGKAEREATNLKLPT
jgi:hypothetical protein